MENELAAALLTSHFRQNAWPRAATTRLFTYAALPHFRGTL